MSACFAGSHAALFVIGRDESSTNQITFFPVILLFTFSIAIVPLWSKGSNVAVASLESSKRCSSSRLVKKGQSFVRCLPNLRNNHFCCDQSMQSMILDSLIGRHHRRE